jgi:phosphate-selective porin OprO and OprP
MPRLAAHNEAEEEEEKEEDSEGPLAWGGLIQGDAGLFDEDKTPVEIRRARLSASGTLGEVWAYESELEFADEEAGITLIDGWLAYSGLRPVTLKVGHQHEPFSLSSMTGTEAQMFQERASNDALLMRRNLGIVLGTHGAQWTLQGGLFGQNLVLTHGYGVSGRVTYAPLAERRRVLHLGLGGKWRSPGTGTLRFGAQEEVDATRVDLADTGPISEVADFTQWGAEFSLVRGPFSVDGEYIHTALRRQGERSHPQLSGWYVQASYFLTGEARAYQPEKGYYEMPTPQCSLGQGGWGAWEVAVRVDGLDLESGEVAGGAQHSLTVGVNGWLTQYLLLRVNYVYTRSHPTSGYLQPEGVEEDTQALTARVQITF